MPELELYHGDEQLAKAGRAVLGEGAELEKWLAEAWEKGEQLWALKKRRRHGWV